jgi:hypothetical protein
MIEIIACVVAVASLGLSLVLARRVLQLEARLQVPLPSSAPVLEESPSKLEGLRIAVAITQDHEHPVFANLLKEELLRRDVAEVMFGDRGDFDLLITGSLVCNGYAEVYYQADLTCRNAHEPICTLVERPPHGDRPSNLALELATKIERELDKLLSRNERRLAIRELSGGD